MPVAIEGKLYGFTHAARALSPGTWRVGLDGVEGDGLEAIGRG